MSARIGKKHTVSLGPRHVRCVSVSKDFVCNTLIYTYQSSDDVLVGVSAISEVECAV